MSRNEVMTEKAYVAGFHDNLMEELSKHVLSDTKLKSLTIGEPGTSVHRVSFFLSGPNLVMVGDHDIVCWARYTGTTVGGAISWMASQGLSYNSYVMEKAMIGMGNIGCEEFHLGVALHEASEKVREYGDDCDKAMQMAWSSIWEALHDEGEEGLQSIRSELYELDESVSLGMVPSARLICAWTLARKADLLLDALNAEVEAAEADRKRLKAVESADALPKSG